MPGVPTGRACEGCRKQKKKCDEKKPACSRCLRLNIPCIGSGERRFKFKEERRFTKSPETDNDRQIITKQEARGFAATAAAVSAAERAARTVFLPPSNELTFLTSVFVQTLKPSTDLRYNLVWNYGGFLAEVPQRLGTNEALDASVYAVCAAHSSFCLYKDISVEALTKYSHALRMLRVCLDDPVKASTPETLCAVLMLLICQAFIGTGGSSFTGHCEGAAKILKARQYTAPQNDFEAKLVLSLRGPVLFEALWNDRIDLTPNEWESLVGSHYDSHIPEGRLLFMFSRVPCFMQRARSALNQCDISALSEEIRPIYEASQDIVDTMQSNYDEVNAIPAHSRSRFLHANHQRIYSLGLVIVTVFNCMLKALDPRNLRYKSESVDLVNKILILCDESHDYRPLGASCNILALMTAWVANTDPITKCVIEAALADYQSDYPVRTLEGMSESLRIINSQLGLFALTT
ncbi:hypothetical protein PISL3812_04900 [Talaromyces islandicus]|uniref:Zn(2)-C6 fungal-type domain-containing protein n=1 Tax=Talaromyces islandicus TaxID=28573 RepID=A0A0U1LWW3_TALIS|nr:hypothetical protein PISL3812_04900 [Talaromyces islandicus]